MKRTLLSLLVMTLVFSNLWAAPVDQATARKVAESFAQTSFAFPARADEMHLVAATDAYYVFNFGTKGFIIVSADDSFRPIVGYSDEGTFPTINPSPEMMYYLNSLGQGRKAALRATMAPNPQIQSEWTALLNEEKLPVRNGKASFYLLKTKWNQDFPYNKFCPTGTGGRAYAGCVATAMSQVMNYWKYPTHGYGSHSYNDFTYGELSANFSEAEYRFDLMPNSIDNMSPEENIDAIALFMYHCGIAVDMMYSPDGSGAYSYDVPDAVLKYFGYSNRCRLFSRNNYSLEEFQAMLKDQLDLGWPCYYSGQDTDGSGGHAYVCDGYDNNDMFHFNWGWSGSGDGFYAIDELNVSGYAFNNDQAFIANFVPSEVFLHTSKAPDLFTATPNGDMDFSVTLTWVNPASTLDGQAFDAIDQLLLMRNGTVIETIENPVPGEAMAYIDMVRQPVTVDYSIQVVVQECPGRMAHVKGVSLGPTCPWTVNLTSDQEAGWTDGGLIILNSEYVTVAELLADAKTYSKQVEVPQGKISLVWKAPSDTLEIGIEVLDSEEQPVFSYQGPSYLMPTGVFYETVNTCGGQRTVSKPTELSATIDNDDVVLCWTGIDDPGYGYNIYRDGCLYGMASDTTCFIDAGAALGYHSYFVTAFCLEGETDPSNTICALAEDDMAPRDLDFTMLDNNRIKLTWAKPLNQEGLSGFIIYRKTVGEEYERLKICGANATQFNVSGNMPEGYRYYFKIVSAYQQGEVLSSPACSLRNPDLLYVEVNYSHLPSNLTLEEQDGQLMLLWEPALLAETYNVYCNGELVAEDLTEPQFADTLRGDALAYQVTGVLNGVESSPSNRACYGSYAVGESTLASVNLYPNPAENLVTVQAEGLREVIVFNLTGQQVMRGKAESDLLQLDLSDLTPGVYFFNILAKQGNRVQKVVVMH